LLKVEALLCQFALLGSHSLLLLVLLDLLSVQLVANETTTESSHCSTNRCPCPWMTNRSTNNRSSRSSKPTANEETFFSLI
jgi:hypothetical protein